MARLLLAICGTIAIVYLLHESDFGQLCHESHCRSAVTRILLAGQPASQPIWESSAFVFESLRKARFYVFIDITICSFCQCLDDGPPSVPQARNMVEALLSLDSSERPGMRPEARFRT